MWQSAAGARHVSLIKHRLLLAAGVSLAGVAAAAAFAPQVGPPLRVEPVVQSGPSLPSFPDIVDSVRASVIGVRSGGPAHAGPPAARSDLHRSGLVAEPQLPPGVEGDEDALMPGQTVATQGSGFFISTDGYAVTNGHVVSGSDTAEVETSDGRTLAAKVIGVDPISDVALLKVDGEGFLPVKIGEQPPRVGEWVLAIGNPFGLGGTVTAGIVSARNRSVGTDPYDDLLQIDAPVNQGNSGGPAFDLDGNVVGVNAMIVSPTGGSIGIAFAVPAETLRSVIPQLKEHGFVSRGWIGVQTASAPPVIGTAEPAPEHGVPVTRVQPDGPAGKAGIARGDIITALDGKPIANSRELLRRVAGAKPGDEVKVGVRRDGKEAVVTVTLGELPVAHPRAARLIVPETKGQNGPGLGLELAAGEGGKGVVVTKIDPRGSAAARGLAPGDLIVEAGGQAVRGPDDVMGAIGKAYSEGRRFVLLQLRTGETTRFVAVPSDPA